MKDRKLRSDSSKLKSSDSSRLKTLSAELVAKSKGELILPSDVMKTIRLLAPEAVLTLEALMKVGKTDTVRLKAALEILALGGIHKTTEIKIKTDVQDMDIATLDSRLTELLSDSMGIAGALIIDHITERDITDITTEVVDRQEEGIARQPEVIEHEQAQTTTPTNPQGNVKEGEPLGQGHDGEG